VRSRWLKIGAGLTVAGLALAGCSSDSGGSSESSPAAPEASAFAGPVGEGEGQLSVLAWPGYAEDGSTDPAIDWVTPFEEQTGCQVDVKTFGTSNEAFDLFKKGGYDVVSAWCTATWCSR
jgi:putative spermidine/putrescine transport system substrate-binding protein